MSPAGGEGVTETDVSVACFEAFDSSAVSSSAATLTFPPLTLIFLSQDLNPCLFIAIVWSPVVTSMVDGVFPTKIEEDV